MAWSKTPDNILAAIFAHLDIFDKIAAGDVCISWRRGLEHPDVWKTIILNAHHFKDGRMSIIVLGFIINNLRYCENLVIYISCHKAYAIVEAAGKVCRHLTRLKVTNSQVRLWVTEAYTFEGLSKSLKVLLSQNPRLKEVDLDDVTLAASSNNEPLPIGLPHARSLMKVRLVNSLDTCSPSPLMYLVNLTQLTISPQFLHYRLIKHLAECSLKCLNLVTKPKVPQSYETLTETQWESLAANSTFTVGLYTMKSIHMSCKWGQHLLSRKMPLRCLVYNKTSWLPYTSLLPFLDTFSGTLEELVDFSLTRDRTNEQCDQTVLSFVKQFPRLHTLSLRSTISTTTLLLMAKLNPGLVHLPVRRDMVTVDLGPVSLDDYPELSFETKRFIEINSQSVEQCESAMTSILGQDWRLLDPEEYCNWMKDRYSSYFGEVMV